jgi:hypothetical protein
MKSGPRRDIHEPSVEHWETDWQLNSKWLIVKFKLEFNEIGKERLLDNSMVSPP